MLRSCRALLAVALLATTSYSHKHQPLIILFDDESENNDTTLNHHDHDHHDNTHDHHHHDEDHNCGTDAPSREAQRSEQIRLTAFQTHSSGKGEGNRRLLPTSCTELCEQCINIEVRLHLLAFNTNVGPVIPHPESSVEMALAGERITEDLFSSQETIATMFADNMEVLNAAFAGTPFLFTWDGQWTTAVSTSVSREAYDRRGQIGQVLSSGVLEILDVFVAYRLTSNGETLGVATLPNVQDVNNGDGVFLRYDVLTGGGYPNQNRGFILVHEIGHWLGLYHTFQLYTTSPIWYNCGAGEVGFGDFVEDTPIARRSNINCVDFLREGAILPDSCPRLPGRDPIFNFMNYVNDDVCYEQKGEFTCGQTERMYLHWKLFREKILSCSDPDEMEIELVIDYGGAYSVGNRITLSSSDGDIVYDSFLAMPYDFSTPDDNTVLVDVCLPRSKMYSLSVEDDTGYGLNDRSTIEIYVDRVLQATITGDFGEFTSIQIQQVVSSEAPSVNPSLQPSVTPTSSISPSASPTATPSAHPSTSPSATASMTPSNSPTAKPSSSPSATPSLSHLPTVSGSPSASPSVSPSTSPSGSPSASPSSSPSVDPSTSPTAAPSPAPTLEPSKAPTSLPTSRIIARPTAAPNSKAPIAAPTSSPSLTPTQSPALAPSGSPSSRLGEEAVGQPETLAPTRSHPSFRPTVRPVTETVSASSPLAFSPLTEIPLTLQIGQNRDSDVPSSAHGRLYPATKWVTPLTGLFLFTCWLL